MYWINFYSNICTLIALMFSANQIEIKYAEIKLIKNFKMKILITNRKEDSKKNVFF